jgi:hypothetical protein
MGISEGELVGVGDSEIIETESVCIVGESEDINE